MVLAIHNMRAFYKENFCISKQEGGQVGGSIASDAEKLAKPFAL
jgi:hypothetical protein